ncbi:MAG: PAS domain S-box protein [Bacteroidota bacterium]
MGKKSLNGIIVLGYSLALGCLFYFLWITYENLQATSQDSHEFTSSLALQQSTEAVFSDIRDIETGTRGYIISGEEEYLKPYYSGKSRIDGDLARLKKTFRNQVQSADARQLYTLVIDRINRSDTQVMLRRRQGIETAINMVHKSRGTQIMDSIRSVVGRIEAGCLLRLNKSNLDKKLMAKNTVRLFFISGGLVIAFLAFSCFLVIRAFRKKSSYEKQVEYLSSMAENVHDAILFTDIGFIITDWNEGASKMFGYRADEAIGKSSVVVLKSNFLFEKRLLITNEILMHGYWKGEVIHQRKNNEPVVGLVTASAVESNNGELGGFMFLIRDITGQKAVEEKLAIVLEAHSEVILLVNDKGIIEAANSNVEDLLGHSEDELKGKMCEEIFPGIQPVMNEHFMQLYKKSNAVHSIQLKTTCCDSNGLIFMIDVNFTFFNTVKGMAFYMKTQSVPEKVLTEFKTLLNTHPGI